MCSIARDELRVGIEAERRDEPRRAQHAQRIVAERDLGRKRRAEPARRRDRRDRRTGRRARDRQGQSTGHEGWSSILIRSALSAMRIGSVNSHVPRRALSRDTGSYPVHHAETTDFRHREDRFGRWRGGRGQGSGPPRASRRRPRLASGGPRERRRSQPQRDVSDPRHPRGTWLGASRGAHPPVHDRCRSRRPGSRLALPGGPRPDRAPVHASVVGSLRRDREPRHPRRGPRPLPGPDREPPTPEDDVTRRVRANPIHSTALGKAILALLPTAEATRILSSTARHPRTTRTRVGLEALAEELDATRQRGYAVDDEENELGSRCVAAGVLDTENRPFAAFSVSAPTVRFDEERLALIGRAVIRSSRELTAAFALRATSHGASSQSDLGVDGQARG